MPSKFIGCAKYFGPIGEDKKQECKVEGCKYKCGAENGPHYSNMNSHLVKAHKISVSLEVDVNQPTLDALPSLSSHEKLALTFSQNGWAYRGVENKFLIELLASTDAYNPPSRLSLSNVMLSTANKLMKAALKSASLRGPCFIGLDAGTVHERYLVLTVIVPCVGAAFVYQVHDFSKKKMTGEAIQETVKAAMTELRPPFTGAATTASNRVRLGGPLWPLWPLWPLYVMHNYG
jgi:hypothetical protein